MSDTLIVKIVYPAFSNMAPICKSIDFVTPYTTTSVDSNHSHYYYDLI